MVKRSKLKYLTPLQIDLFKQQGYLSPFHLLSTEACSDLKKKIECFERKRSHDVIWAFDIKANLLFDWVYKLGAQQQILDIVEDLLGPNIFNTNTVFRIKEPGSSTSYGWHQDAARIDVRPCFIIAYVAISESTPENGGLRVLPGSHSSILPFDVVENEDGQARRKVARTVGVVADNAVDLQLAPGEVAFFSGRIVHGSGPNLSRYRRIAILTDYTAAHARQSLGRGSGQLVRGHDDFNHLAHEPVPVGSCTEASVIQRRHTLLAYPENPLMGPLPSGEIAKFPDQPTTEKG